MNRHDTWLEKHPIREVSPNVEDRMPCGDCGRQEMCEACAERIERVARLAWCNGTARQLDLLG